MASVVSFFFRVIMGGIFLVSGLAKISDPYRFILTMREFRLFPEVIVPFTAVYLPWLEFVVGLFILLGLMHRSSALILLCLNMIFTAAIVSVMVRGIDVDCGCFGLLADMLGMPDMADYKAVVRNIVFILMNVQIMTARKSALSLEGYLRRKAR